VPSRRRGDGARRGGGTVCTVERLGAADRAFGGSGSRVIGSCSLVTAGRDEIYRRKHGGAAATTYLAVGGAVELDDPARWVSRGGVAGACATVAVERGAPLG
jgi:hypothetical protein